MLVRIVLFNLVTSDRGWVSAVEGREGKLGTNSFYICRYLYVLG